MVDGGRGFTLRDRGRATDQTTPPPLNHHRIASGTKKPTRNAPKLWKTKPAPKAHTSARTTAVHAPNRPGGSGCGRMPPQPGHRIAVVLTLRPQSGQIRRPIDKTPLWRPERGRRGNLGAVPQRFGGSGAYPSCRAYAIRASSITEEAGIRQ